MQKISKSKFKAQALEIFWQVESSGEPVVITDHGEPKLVVRPFQQQSKKPLDVLRGSVLHFDHPTDPVADKEWKMA